MYKIVKKIYKNDYDEYIGELKCICTDNGGRKDIFPGATLNREKYYIDDRSLEVVKKRIEDALKYARKIINRERKVELESEIIEL